MEGIKTVTSSDGKSSATIFSGNMKDFLDFLESGKSPLAGLFGFGSIDNTKTTEQEDKFINTTDDLVAFIKADQDFTLTVKTLNLMLTNEEYKWRTYRAFWVVTRLINVYTDANTETRPKISPVIHDFIKTGFEIFPENPDSRLIETFGTIILTGTNAGLEGIWEICTEFVNTRASTWTIGTVYRFVTNLIKPSVDDGFPDNMTIKVTTFIRGLYDVITEKMNFEGEPVILDMESYFVPFTLALCNRTESERTTAVARIRTIVHNHATTTWVLPLLNSLIDERPIFTSTDEFKDAILEFRRFRTEITEIQERPHSEDSDKKDSE
jgi:hypothetical protein